MHRWVCLALVCAAPAFAHEDDEVTDAGVPAPVHHTTTVRSARPTHGAGESVVARDVIDAAPRTGATDLLRLVPGLVASQHSGEGKAQQLFLRGFDAVHGQDVELNVAGLPVNEVSHIHALGYADLNWLIPAAVREVKVTEGSSRAWQGDFAVAGTVRYELGLEEEGFTFSVGAGRFNRYRLFAGFRPHDSPETFAAVEYVQGDGFGPSRAFGRVSAMGQGVLQLDRVKLRVVLASYGTRFDSPGVERDSIYVNGGSFFGVFGQGQGGSASRHQLLLAADVPDEGGKTGIEVYGLLLDTRLRNNFTGFLGNPLGDGLEQQQHTNTEGGKVTSSRHLHVGDQLLHLDVGVGLRRDGIHQTQRGYDELSGQLREPILAGAATASREAIDADIVQTMGSAWAELAWAPGAWRFMVGGRVDVLHVELFDRLAYLGAGTARTAFGPHVGAKAAIERGLGEHFRAFLSYGDGFRTPQARQLSDGERAPFIDVHGGELGVKFDSSRVAASLLGFTSYVQNDFFFDHTAGTTRFVGSTLRGGGQAAVTTRPIDGLLFALNVTLAQAHLLEKDALLPYFAPLVSRLDGSYTRSFDVLGVAVTPLVGLGVTFIGPRPLPYNEFSRPIFLMDLKLAVRVWKVEVSADIQNLLDVRWRDGEFEFASKWDASPTASVLPARQFTAGAPRSVMFNLEVHL